MPYRGVQHRLARQHAASELFYDLLATTGLMILGVRKRCMTTGLSYV